MYKNNIFWFALFSLILVIFLALSFSRIHQIVPADDLWDLLSAKSLYEKGVPELYCATDKKPFFQNPYLYLYALAWMFGAFGANEIAARLVGIISGLISIFLVFLIVRISSKGSENSRLRLAIIVSGLYALAPTTIQGTAIINIDNTLLVPAILFIFWAVIRFFQAKDFIRLCLVCFTVALSFWLRLSTPLIIILTLILYSLISRNSLKIKIAFIGTLIFAFLFFVASWFFYCKIKGAPFLGPFIYTFGTFARSHSHLTIPRILQNSVYLTLWVGFLPLLTVTAIILKKHKFLLRDIQMSPHFILFCALFLMGGYTTLGGVGFGYPRYHSPAIPLLYIGAALFLSKEDFKNFNLKRIAGLFLVSFLIHFFILGDLLYIFRYVLRDYLAFRSPSSWAIIQHAIFRIIFFCLAYTMLFLVGLRLLSRGAIIALLVIFSAASSLSMTFLQSVAKYNTGYDYGERGMLETAQYIRNKMPPDGIVVGPEGLIYYMRLPNSPYLRGSFWSNIDRIERSLRDPRVSAFVYSIPTNEVSQIQSIREDVSVQKLLSKNFKYRKIGTYDIWVRSYERR